MKREFIVVQESLAESIARDLSTFGFVLLSIYVSQGSTWWTFVTGLMFIVLVSAKLTIAAGNTIVIKSKAEAIEWAESFEDDAK